MASVQLPLALPPPNADYQVQEPKDNSSDTDDSENIPYHARQSARPFTYGNLPPGFKQSELNHVTFEDMPESSNSVHNAAAAAVTPTAAAAAAPPPLPPSPSMPRKSTRPSISPSRPVLRKTPSRQEFEEMLMERREQALREQNNTAVKLAQNAAIQKDLDELQEKLNKRVILQQEQAAQQQQQQSKEQQQQNQLALIRAGSTDVVKHVETVDLPDAVSSAHNKYEPALLIAEKRSETPSFPVEQKAPLDDERCISPYPMVTPGTPTLQRITAAKNAIMDSDVRTENTSNNKTVTYSSHVVTNEPQEVEPHLVKFAKDYSEFWYKPHITREEAVTLLRNAAPGTFLIRNSTTYKNAYGLVLRVVKPPPGVPLSDSANGIELVRHFLLEPTARGVRLKGCVNEPVFTSLSAFVYQHSINQLALPCQLIIPDRDLLYASGDHGLVAAQKQLMLQGAACNVLYLFTCDMESLTGNEAIRKAVYELFAQQPLPAPTEVHFKVSQQGITLTDNTRKLFFRRHYVPQNISHIGIDPDNRFFRVIAYDDGLERQVNKTIFGFVARPLVGAKDNQCHLFCDLAANQPASAIIAFAHKVLPLSKANNKML